MTGRLVAILALGACITVLAAEPEDGLVASYNLGEGMGNTLKDSSGNGNNGRLLPDDGVTYSGPVWINADGGNYLEFDGKEDYVVCGNKESLQFTDALTMSAWVKPENAAGNQYVISKYGYNLRLGGNDALHIAMETRDAADKNWGEVRSDPVVPVGKWTFLTAVFDSKEKHRRIFVNGKLVRDDDAGGPLGGVAGEALHLGRYVNPTQYFRGQLGPVRIWSRALSDEEVRKLYQTDATKMGMTGDKTPEGK